MLTRKKINAAIAHTELEVIGNAGDGYFYFLDSNCEQAGEAVMVNRFNHLRLESWVREAEEARQALNESLATRNPTVIRLYI